MNDCLGGPWKLKKGRVEMEYGRRQAVGGQPHGEEAPKTNGKRLPDMHMIGGQSVD